MLHGKINRCANHSFCYNKDIFKTDQDYEVGKELPKKQQKNGSMKGKCRKKGGRERGEQQRVLEELPAPQSRRHETQSDTETQGHHEGREDGETRTDG